MNNRDEAETYDLHKAINSGYDNLYITSPDILDKRMEELDKQIEIEAIQKANDAVLEVRQESEKEKALKEKERNYEDAISKMAEFILESNKDLLGEEVVGKAKECI